MRGLCIFGFAAFLLGLVPAAATEQPVVCELPKKTHGVVDYFSPIVQLAVLPSGEVRWNGNAIDDGVLESYLAEFIKADPQPILQLSARDPNTPWRSVTPLLRKIQAHRLEYLWFETYRPAYTPPDIPAFITNPARTPFVVQCWLGRDAPPVPEPDITLAIAPDGRPMKNGETTDWYALDQELTRAAARNPQPSVLLAPSQRTPFLPFTELLLFVLRSEFQRVQISTEGGSAPSK